jgi:hypothetical protein
MLNFVHKPCCHSSDRRHTKVDNVFGEAEGTAPKGEYGVPSRRHFSKWNEHFQEENGLP